MCKQDSSDEGKPFLTFSKYIVFDAGVGAPVVMFVVGTLNFLVVITSDLWPGFCSSAGYNQS